MLRLLTTLIALISISGAIANPIIESHPAYITSEALTAVAATNAIEFDGVFRFRSTPAKEDPKGRANVYFTVPVWIPSDPEFADVETKKLLATFSASELNWLKKENQSVWDSAVGMKITVGKRPLTIDTFAIFDPSSPEDQKRIPEAWQRAGFYCLTVRVDFPPEWLEGEPEIRISYRQGMRRGEGGCEFVYVPNFWNFPTDATTKNLDSYSLRLINEAEGSLSLGGAVIGPGFTAILPLSHHVAIEGVIQNGANKSSQINALPATSSKAP